MTGGVYDGHMTFAASCQESDIGGWPFAVVMLGILIFFGFVIWLVLRRSNDV